MRQIVFVLAMALPGVLALNSAQAATLNVCASGCAFTLPSQAMNAAADGDIINIQAGSYRDCVVVNRNNITLQGVNGMAAFSGSVCWQKGIIVTTAQNATLRNLELSGASNGENYAGIRHDATATNLTLDNVYSHDNDNGILSSTTGDTLTILNSKFQNNGRNSSTGYAHNLYIGHSALVTFRNSESLAAKLQGHEFKSRAARTEIYNSTLATLGGADSRLIDVSNGGTLIVQDSVLQKSPSSDNNEMIAWGPEGLASGRTHSVTITGNKVIGDRVPTDLLAVFNGTPAISISGNTLVAIRTVTNLGSAGANTVYSSRSAAGYQAYPWLPTPGGSTPPPTTTTTTTTTTSTTMPSSSSWVFCANEGGTCSFTGTRVVRYGANGSYATKTVTGSIACTNDAFGNDPAYGIAKTCEYSNSTTVTPPTTTLPPPTSGDTQTPTVSITSPANNSTVPRKSTVNISVSASDNVGVTRVVVLIDGATQCTVTSAPYNCSFKTSNAPGKVYQLEAQASDAAGNLGRSSVIRVQTN